MTRTGTGNQPFVARGHCLDDQLRAFLLGECREIRPCKDDTAILGEMSGVSQVKRCLGEGDFGRVFLCLVGWREEPVAVKVLQQETLTESGPQQRLLDGHGHPNLVKLLRVVSDGPSCCLFLEFCAGGSLKALIRGPQKEELRRLVEPNEWASTVLAVASALAYLETEDIVHRDVKPGSIMLTHPYQPGSGIMPNVKLGDLGLAREVDQVMTSGVRTVRYMAPEVMYTGGYSFPADIYSTGILLHELVSGEEPYSEHKWSHGQILVAVASGQRPLLDVVPESARALIPAMEACWAARPAERPSAIHLEAQLQLFAFSG